MGTYLDLASLKMYLRIDAGDAIDDALLTQIVDAVEAEQRAGCVPAAFTAGALTATNTAGLTVALAVSGCGSGPFTWQWGDGMSDVGAVGELSNVHTYGIPGGSYTPAVWLDDVEVLGAVPLSPPFTDPLIVPVVSRVSVPADLYQAALMRGARLYARRASPEGLVGLGELGVARIPVYDRDIDALESPWRSVVLA